MKPVPAPAIIDGVEWQVRDSGNPRLAYVDFSSKTMVVPMDCGDVGDLLRNHEMAHVKITPRDPTMLEELAREFPNRTLQAAEDCRVYAALNNAGINTDVSHWPDSDIEAVAAMPPTPANREEQLRGLIATKGTGDYARLSAVLDPALVAKAESLYAEHYAPAVERGEIPTFDACVAMAREAHSYCNAAPPPPSPGGEGDEPEGESDGKNRGNGKGSESSDSKDEGESDAREDEDGSESDGEHRNGSKDLSRPFTPGDTSNTASPPAFDPATLTDDEMQDLKDLLGADAGRYLAAIGTRGGGEILEPSRVKFLRPKLSRPQKGRTAGARKVCTDTGSVPRRLSRYATDGAVFSKTVKKGFASVVVDCSGSMSFTTKDVEEIVDSLPHCNVAVYSGRGEFGQIVLVAKDGKRVDEMPPFLGGNVVDFQAVEWLAKQRGPRYWICDGMVTGKSDAFLSPLNCLTLARVCKLGKIKRFGSLEDLLKGLSEKKSTYAE